MLGNGRKWVSYLIPPATFIVAERPHSLLSPTQRKSQYLACFGLCCAVLMSGCSSSASRDVYRQRMASEIRVLEDQLYDADYQNRVLREKLERATGNQQIQRDDTIDAGPPLPPDSTNGPMATESLPYAPAISPPERNELDQHNGGFDVSDSHVPTPVPDPNTSPGTINLEEGFDDSFVDPGVPMSDRELGDPFSDDVQPDDIDTGVPRLPKKRTPQDGDGESRVYPLPPPIGGPEPPGKKDTEAPLLDPGEASPPVSPEGKSKPTPPGRIKLPDAVSSTKAKLTPPESIKLHEGLSGAHHTDADEQADGVKLIVQAVDKFGATVDLNNFEIDAEMTVVILDPSRDPSEARIGRWEFESEEVETLLQTDPISGLQIPLLWQEEIPNSDELIVHVRLRSEEDEMRCKGYVGLTDTPATVARWTPRAGDDADDDDKTQRE